MRIINNLLIILISLLSIAAGLAKVMLAPQEVGFLQSFGLNNTAVITFGVIQILGGALLSHSKVRFYGAIITTIGFLISTALIFVSGDLIFGMVSLLPVILSSVLIIQSAKLHITRASIGTKKVG